MMRNNLLRIVGISILTATVGMGQSPKHLSFPGDVPGPPIYAQISHLPGFDVGEYYHTDEWAAVVFHRDPACVPPAFNLLDGFDLPAVFGCRLSIQGFEIWHAPFSEGIAPIEVRGWGLGAVPIYFVSWRELQTAVSDRLLTIGELRTLPSLTIGAASSFHLGIRPGLFTLPGIEMFARGVLRDGRQFQFEASAGGESIQPKHVKIEFR
jgi:hypothetical protein